MGKSFTDHPRFYDFACAASTAVQTMVDQFELGEELNLMFAEARANLLTDDLTKFLVHLYDRPTAKARRVKAAELRRLLLESALLERVDESPAMQAFAVAMDRQNSPHARFSETRLA